MLLPRTRLTSEKGPTQRIAAGLRSDGWDGYPATLYDVLNHIVKHDLRNVIFLSGDAHIPCICYATITSDNGTSVDIISVHGSALYAPLPFANGKKEDYTKAETFTLTPPGNNQNTLTISYRTEFPDCGDGYAVLEMTQPGDNTLVNTKISFAGKYNRYTTELFHQG